MLSSSYQYPGSIYKPVSRTKFSDQQQDILSEAFNKNPYPDRSTKRMISKKTGLDIGQIRVWFQNKRARMRFNMQKDTVTKRQTLPTIFECGDRNDKQGVKKTKDLARLPSETNSLKDIVNTLQYCKKALSGWPKVALKDGNYIFEEDTDISSTDEDEKLSNAVQKLLEA